MNNEVYDVAIIGGGPAGMMSAGISAESLGRVILLEKNPSLGAKLLITGGSRCNLTNAEFDVRKFLSKYKDSDKFLFSAFSQFSVKDTIDFFNSHGMATKIEPGNRVFPTSDKAESVWNVLYEYMKAGNVEVKTKAIVSGFEMKDGKIVAVKLKDGEKIFAKKYILATGGTSRPETGSTGDGFKWLAEIGHKIIPPDNALVPIALNMTGKSAWLKDLQGVVLQDVKITTYQNNIKQESKIGRILFTHFGLSGPTILNMSRSISELLKYGNVEIRMDILPSLNREILNTKLQELFLTDNKKKIKNSLNAIIPSPLVNVVLSLAGIDENKENNSITRVERIRLIETIKTIPMEVSGILGADKAIVSSGGVDLTEVDFKTMQSRIIPNLYLVGDILNIDRPSGGYSLQLCWTTGYVAGKDCK